MNKNGEIIAVVLLVVCSAVVAVAGDEAMVSASNAWSRVKDEGARALVAAKVKAALVDRKDIPSRYIRIRFDGRALQLAGFVPNRQVAEDAEALARKVAEPVSLQAFWSFDETIGSGKTFIGERAGDLSLTAKVLASLHAPDVRPQFKHAEIVHVNVNDGKVTIYIVADAAPGTFDLAPHVLPIPGVTEVLCQIVKTF